MITVNQIPLPWGKWAYGGIFPSGELKATAFKVNQRKNTIIFHWQPGISDGEMMWLRFIREYIRERAPKAKNTLIMGYVPNGRLDKELGEDINNGVELLPLNKYTAYYFNELQFDKVIGIEPHSSAFEKEYNNSASIYPTMNTISIIGREIGLKNRAQLVFPDIGSFKRYEKIINDRPDFADYSDYLIIHKERNDGEVQNVWLDHGSISENKDVFLIVDDICSKGNTALETAKILTEKSEKKREIYLLVAYLERSALDNPNGILSEDTPFTKIFVCGPNPFDTIYHPKVKYFSFAYNFK